MPLKEIDYSNTHFYRIACKDLNITDCYVGHTTNFNSRKTQHKSNVTNVHSKKYNYMIYQKIRDCGGWDNWSMVWIKTRSCENYIDACKIEREYIEKYKATLNAYRPHRTNDERLQQMQEYRQNNMEEINLKKREKHNCKCGGKTTQCQIARHNKSKKHQQWLVSQQEPEGEPDET